MLALSWSLYHNQSLLLWAVELLRPGKTTDGSLLIFASETAIYPQEAIEGFTKFVASLS